MEALIGVGSDAEMLNLTLLQLLSKRRRNWRINREVGDLAGESLVRRTGGAEALLTFQRYDVKLEVEWLREKLGRNFTERRLDELRDFTDPQDMIALYRLAAAAAKQQIETADFADEFKIR
jgi:hypothetical protein